MDKNKWIPVLKAMLAQRANRVTLATSRSASGEFMQLAGLLLAMQDIIQRGHAITDGVHISNGEVEEEAITDFSEHATHVRLRVRLQNITVVLKKEHEDEQLYAKKLRDKICSRIELTDDCYRAKNGQIFVFN